MNKKELVRSACVAGRFYPGTVSALSKQVESLLAGNPKPEDDPKSDAIAVISPHAGYMYSGPTAGRVLSSVNIPDRVILLGPNHTGMGTPASVMPSGIWEIPTGDVEIDEELSQKVLASSELFQSDFEAHLMEHSLEVMLPFIHAINPSAKIVPITIMQADQSECSEMGKALADVISKAAGRVLILVSSDMNHYEPDSVTRVKDKLAIEKIIALDPKGLLEVVERQEITMCGVIPAAIALYASRSLNAKHGRLVNYTTSGEVNGEMNAVVGYAGIIID